MIDKFENAFNPQEFRSELVEHNHDLGELPGWMFEGLLLYADWTGIPMHHRLGDGLDLRTKQAMNTAKFAGAEIAHDLEDKGITHVIVGNEKAQLGNLRAILSR